MSWADVLDLIGSGRRQDGNPRLDYVDAPPYFLTAYGIAVKHGFTGTEEEWLASLRGDPGASTTVAITQITGGYRVTFTDADHPAGQSYEVYDGEDGEDGVSPAVTISTITGGHRVTITDASHPSGQNFDVMDGEDGSGDMDSSTYDPASSVATAGGIPAFVSAAISGKQSSIRLTAVSLSTSWSGSGPYTQTVSITGATASSRVDLQPTAAQLAALMEDGVTALVIENNAGTLTAYALGSAPSAAMTVQCTVTEVGA